MNLKLTIVGTIVTLMALFGGAFWLSRPQAKPEVKAASSGQLTASDTSYNFGTISMAKGIVSQKFSLINNDSVPATVTKLFSSCMCTKAALEVEGQKWGPFGMPGHQAIPGIAAEIPAGKEGVVEVMFDPAAHGPTGVGVIDRQVTVELNGQSPLILKIHADVTP